MTDCNADSAATRRKRRAGHPDGATAAAACCSSLSDAGSLSGTDASLHLRLKRLLGSSSYNVSIPSPSCQIHVHLWIELGTAVLMWKQQFHDITHYFTFFFF